MDGRSHSRTTDGSLRNRLDPYWVQPSIHPVLGGAARRVRPIRENLGQKNLYSKQSHPIMEDHGKETARWFANCSPRTTISPRPFYDLYWESCFSRMARRRCWAGSEGTVSPEAWLSLLVRCTFPRRSRSSLSRRNSSVAWGSFWDSWLESPRSGLRSTCLWQSRWCIAPSDSS